MRENTYQMSQSSYGNAVEKLDENVLRQLDKSPKKPTSVGKFKFQPSKKTNNSSNSLATVVPPKETLKLPSNNNLKENAFTTSSNGQKKSSPVFNLDVSNDKPKQILDEL